MKIMNPIKYILLFGVLSLVSCNKNNNTKNESQTTEDQADNNIFVSKAQFESAKMSFGNPIEKDFAQTVHTTGELDVPPQNIAEISSFSGGYIKHTHLLRSEEHTSELQSRPHLV